MSLLRDVKRRIAKQQEAQPIATDTSDEIERAHQGLGLDNYTELTSMLRAHPYVYFFPYDGDLGSAAEMEASLRYFEAIDIEAVISRPGTEPSGSGQVAVVLGGKTNAKKVLEISSQFEKVIILPTSFTTDDIDWVKRFDARVVVFCRDIGTRRLVDSVAGFVEKYVQPSLLLFVGAYERPARPGVLGARQQRNVELFLRQPALQQQKLVCNIERKLADAALQVWSFMRFVHDNGRGPRPVVGAFVSKKSPQLMKGLARITSATVVRFNIQKTVFLTPLEEMTSSFFTRALENALLATDFVVTDQPVIAFLCQRLGIPSAVVDNQRTGMAQLHRQYLQNITRLLKDYEVAGYIDGLTITQRADRDALQFYDNVDRIDAVVELLKEHDPWLGPHVYSSASKK